MLKPVSLIFIQLQKNVYKIKQRKKEQVVQVIEVFAIIKENSFFALFLLLLFPGKF
jgi:hypothetical protein